MLLVMPVLLTWAPHLSSKPLSVLEAVDMCSLESFNLVVNVFLQ